MVRPGAPAGRLGLPLDLPNIGTTGGGAWVWDETTFFHVEVPYHACCSSLRLAAERD